MSSRSKSGRKLMYFKYGKLPLQFIAENVFSSEGIPSSTRDAVLYLKRLPSVKKIATLGLFLLSKICETFKHSLRNLCYFNLTLTPRILNLRCLLKTEHP